MDLESKQTDSSDAYAEKYRKKIWTSRGSRFVASRRLHRQNHASQLVVSFFSLIVIAAAVALLILPPDYRLVASIISAISIDASVFILVLSNLEFAKSYGVQADRMFKGAQALSPLLDEIERMISIRAVTVDSVASWQETYNHILNEYEVGHEEIDYQYFQTQYPAVFNISRLRMVYLRINIFLHVWGLYLLCIVVPPAILAGALLIYARGLPAFLK